MAAKAMTLTEEPAFFLAAIDSSGRPRPEDRYDADPKAHGLLAGVTLKLYLNNDHHFTLIETIANDPMLNDPFRAMNLKRDDTPALYLNIEKRGWAEFLKDLRSHEAMAKVILQHNQLP